MRCRTATVAIWGGQVSVQKLPFLDPEWTLDTRRLFGANVVAYPRVRGDHIYNIPLSAKHERCKILRSVPFTPLQHPKSTVCSNGTIVFSFFRNVMTNFYACLLMVCPFRMMYLNNCWKTVNKWSKKGSFHMTKNFIYKSTLVPWTASVAERQRLIKLKLWG